MVRQKTLMEKFIPVNNCYQNMDPNSIIKIFLATSKSSLCKREREKHFTSLYFHVSPFP